MDFLNFLTLLSYVALNVDILLQLRRIHLVNDVRDISLAGALIRYVAIWIILYKLICVGDVYLIIGQALITIIFTGYLLVLLAYRKKPTKKKTK